MYQKDLMFRYCIYVESLLVHLPLTNKYEARMMSFAITDGFSCVIESYLLEALLGRHLKVFLSILICFVIVCVNAELNSLFT